MYSEIRQAVYTKITKKDANKSFLPVRGINKIGLSDNSLLKIYVYGMIAGSNGAISQSALVRLTGCSYQSISSCFTYLKNNEYIEMTGKNVYKVPTYKIIDKKETHYNFDWNIFKVSNKYGALTARAFGLYFYMRSANNKNRLGNGYYCISNEEAVNYILELYVLQESGLVKFFTYKEQIIIHFDLEYKYEVKPSLIKELEFERMEIELPTPLKKKLEEQYKSDEVIEKMINKRKKQQDDYFSSELYFNKKPLK